MVRDPSSKKLGAGVLYELAYYANQSGDEPLIEFLKDQISRSSPGPRVLDCACGTGEPGLELAGHFSMTLTDAEAPLLRVARQKAKRRGLEGLRILRARWDELPTRLPGEQFDTVLCCGGALTQGLSPEIRRDSLAGMKAMLKPDGLLYIDFEEWTFDQKPGKTRPVEVAGPVEWRGGHFVIVIAEGREKSFIRRTKTAYHLKGGKLVEAGSAVTRYIPLSQGELRGYLEELGFKEIRFTERPGRWPMTVVLARRPAHV